jgi:hypothetical protein
VRRPEKFCGTWGNNFVNMEIPEAVLCRVFLQYPLLARTFIRITMIPKNITDVSALPGAHGKIRDEDLNRNGLWKWFHYGRSVLFV